MNYSSYTYLGAMSIFLFALCIIIISIFYYYLRFKAYSKCFASLPVSWILWNSSKNKITSFSLPQGIFNERVSKLSMVEFFEFIKESDRQGFKQWLGEREDSSPYILEMKSGFIFEVTCYSINQGLFVLWLKDITFILEAERKVEEAMLKQDHLHQLLDSLPYPVWSYDSQKRICFANKVYSNLVGDSQENILRHNLDIKSAPLSISGRASKNVDQVFIVNGERKRLRLWEKPIFSENIIVGYGIDFTEVETLKDDLERNTQGYNELLGYLSTGIAMYGSDGKLTFFNHAYAKLVEPLGVFLHSQPTLGEVLEELRRHRWLPDFPDFQAFKKAQLSLFTSLSSPLHELQYLPSGKTLRMVTAPNPLGGLIFLFEDITEAIKLEGQYNTLIAVQQATIDELFEGVVVFSSDNRLKIFNPAFVRIWNIDPRVCVPGVSMAELMEQAKPLLQIKGSWEELKQKMIRNVTDRVSKNGSIYTMDKRVVDFSYIPLPDGANMISYFARGQKLEK